MAWQRESCPCGFSWCPESPKAPRFRIVRPLPTSTKCTASCPNDERNWSLLSMAKSHQPQRRRLKRLPQIIMCGIARPCSRPNFFIPLTVLETASELVRGRVLSRKMRCTALAELRVTICTTRSTASSMRHQRCRFAHAGKSSLMQETRNRTRQERAVSGRHPTGSHTFTLTFARR